MSNNTKPTNLLESALCYASRGWPVLPLHTPQADRCSCTKNCGNHTGKHPRWDKQLIPNGLKNATTDPKIITQWWERWPDANIAVATGLVSGLIVIDIDPRNGGHETILKLQKQYGELPKSLRVRSGSGGWHIYLQHPGGHVKSTTIAAGVDVKADGGYVVAPPSLHVSGKLYIWEN